MRGERQPRSDLCLRQNSRLACFAADGGGVIEPPDQIAALPLDDRDLIAGELLAVEPPTRFAAFNGDRGIAAWAGRVRD